MNRPDLDAYLRRIAWHGALEASCDALAAICAAHTAAIPFENLDPLLGVPVALDTESLMRKLVHGGRGGYCYEHNLLLGATLREMGFEVRDLAARVRWGVPTEQTRPRTHMLLLVSVSALRCIVDAGFGGLTLTGALRLDERGAQRTPHGLYRLLHAEDEYELQAQLGGGWESIYTFDLQPQRLPDYELTSWTLCNRPGSIFRNSLMVARVVRDQRCTLLNNALTERAPDGAAATRICTHADDLRSVLADTFGIDLTMLRGLDAMLASLVHASPDALKPP